MIFNYKLLFFICFLIHVPVKSYLQEAPEMAEQNIESVSEEMSTETVVDEWTALVEKFTKQPLNLNLAKQDELKEFYFLTEIQINQFLSYKEVLGGFIDIYELQAIPSWDLETIRKLIPFVTVAGNMNPVQHIRNRFRNGMHALTLRVSIKPGSKTEQADNKYRGSLPAVLFRYNYNHKNILYAGINGDKDAGEEFFKGKQKTGFDFYSAHFYLKDAGKIKSLAVGDFTVNMGQGLIQWQGMAFRKNADASLIKRQSRLINPYRSSGEFYFFRGLGFTLKTKKLESSFFISYRKIDSNQFFDSIKQKTFITSFLSSGFHRTDVEIQKKGNAAQSTAGGNIFYQIKSFKVGLNFIHYLFSPQVQKRNEPYNLFALHGMNWQNASIDYSYTRGNVHFFGEFALDKNRQKAFLNGMLLSFHNQADLIVLHRSIDRSYQAVYGNAFTENTLPGNERGLYAGLILRPAMAWRIDAYIDRFSFPWISYSVNAPSGGTEYALQVNYSPSKRFSAYTRFRVRQKRINHKVESSVIQPLLPSGKINWRTHVIYKINPDFIMRARVEAVWIRQEQMSAGYLGFLDLLYKPLMKSFSLSLRMQYFETGDYESRVYAYENDVPNSYAVPSFSGTGYRYYILLNYDFSRNLQGWLRIAATRGEKGGNDQVMASGSSVESDIKIQFRIIF